MERVVGIPIVLVGVLLTFFSTDFVRTHTMFQRRVARVDTSGQERVTKVLVTAVGVAMVMAGVIVLIVGG